jgi:hypothetical protein
MIPSLSKSPVLLSEEAQLSRWAMRIAEEESREPVLN